MGERVKAEGLKSRVVPALLGGTRRDLDADLLALGPDREHAVLNALSLAGQALRFTRPSVPKVFAVESWPHDERRIVPDRMRSKILRLLDRCTDDTARAVALAFEKQRLRPHLFDLPRIDGFVRKYADQLGVTAQYWTQRGISEPQSRGYFDANELTVETWTEAPLRKRVRFLKDLRKQNPEAGRQLVQKNWPAENPDSRVQLISTFRIGLSGDDNTFLESLQKDRAPRVREVVRRLLGAVSSRDAENPALAACMERIQKSKSGVLKKRTVVKLELPATVKEREADHWIQEHFAELTLDEFARSCELTQSGLVEAAEKDTNLLFALALMASHDRNFGLLGAIADAMPDLWGRMSELNWEDSLLDDSRERQEWAEALIRPKKWLPEVPFPAWSWLHRQMEGPLPLSIMKDILMSAAWKNHLGEEKKGPSLEIIQVISALCPRELRGTIRAQIEPLDVERKEKGMMLLDILDELESLT
jgi:hypothetical protein